jgi:hypothetical protein
MRLILFTLLTAMVLSGVGSCMVEESDQQHLEGLTVGVERLTTAESTDNNFISGYWVGTVVDSWYQFVKIQWKDGNTEWINSCYVHRIIGSPK